MLSAERKGQGRRVTLGEGSLFPSFARVSFDHLTWLVKCAASVFSSLSQFFYSTCQGILLASYYSVSQQGRQLRYLAWGEEGRNPGLFSEDSGIPKRSLVRNFPPQAGLLLRKPQDTMSELKSRKIRGLYTLYTKILYSTVL